MAARSRQKDFRQMMEQGKKVSENIVLCADGKYRWTYELSLWKDASIFLLVWKILFFVILGIISLILIMKKQRYPDVQVFSLQHYSEFHYSMEHDLDLCARC